MSVIYKLKEFKDDGWQYIEEFYNGNKTAIIKTDIWENILNNILNDYKTYKILQNRDIKQIKEEIKKHINNYLNDLKYELIEEDLKYFIKIYPLINKNSGEA